MRKMDNEKQILERAKKGDKDAMAAIIENNQRNVFALAYRMTGNRENALDIAQDTFIKAIHNVKKFRGDSKISTWLYSIAANVSRDHLRKHGRVDFVPLEETWIKSADDSPLKITEENEKRDLVRRGISTLPPKMREVFVLRYEENLPIAEIAEVLNRSQGTVKAQIFQATEKIRAFVQ